MRYYTDDGTPYYENLETQETSWDAPPSFIEATDDGIYEEEVEVGDLISLLFSSLLFSSLLFSSLLFSSLLFSFWQLFKNASLPYTIQSRACLAYTYLISALTVVSTL